jgi:FG-GAP repeat
MKTKITHLFAGFTTALLMGSFLTTSAAELGKSQKLSSPDQVPEGLSASDWQSIRSTYAAGQTTQTAGVISQQAYLKASNTGAEDFFGGSIAVSGDTVVVGAAGESSNAVGVNGNQADNSAIISGAAYVFVRSGGVWSQQAYLKASNTGGRDNFSTSPVGDVFGGSVAISGDTIIVGAAREDSNAVGVNGNQADNSASDSGAAYIFVRRSGAWSQQAYLKASNTGANDYFGFSVAISGETVVVGAYIEDSAAVGVNGNQTNDLSYNSGAAYVFVRNGGDWSQQAYLKASNTGANDYFGTSVAISGDTVVIGAYGEESSALGVNGDQTNDLSSDSGAAYVFERSSGTWSQQAYLKASNNAANDYFSNSIAVSGDTIVVGAYREGSNALGVNGNQADNSAEFSGAAYVFVRSGITWSQQAYLKASNTEANDYFGNSVAVSGDTVVVGAAAESSNAVGVNGNQADNNAYFSGAAYVFVRSGISWSQQAYLKASSTGWGYRFASSVAVSGDTFLVGAGGVDSSSGAAYIFSPLIADTTLPSLLVTGKVPKMTAKKSILIQGTASNASGIRSVQYAIGKNPLKTAIGTTAWQIKPALKKGKNEIGITATDNAGNVSAKTVIKIKRK